MADIKIGSKTYTGITTLRVLLSDGSGYAVFKMDSETGSVTFDSYDVFVPIDTTDDYIATGYVLDVSTSEFLELFYDGFVDSPPNGVTVTKTSIGKDESGQYDMWEYDFKPTNYTRTILLSSGMHTYELAASFGLANFIGNLYTNTDNEAFNYIRENVRIKIIPIINPWGFNQSPKKYGNVNGVNPNRNFDLDGQWSSFPVYTPSQNEWNVKGNYPFSEAEVSNIAKWAINNYNAEFWIDCHTGEGYADKDLWVYYSSDSVILDRINGAISRIETWFKETYGSDCVTTRTIDSDGSIRLRFAENIVGIAGMTLEQAPKRTTFGTSATNEGADISNYSTNISTFVQEFLLEKYRDTSVVEITSVSASDVTMAQDELSKTVEVTITPIDTTQNHFEWTSNNENVVEVYGGTNKAVLINKGSGSATITLTNRYNSSIVTSFNVEVTEAETYNVTNNLTNTTTSNTTTTVLSGSAYSATLTPNDEYELYSVSITMGGVNVTDSVYADGVITIASVTGDVVITATSRVVVEADENMICDIGSISLGTDGSESTSATRLRSVEYYPCNSKDVVSAEICAISSNTGVVSVNNARMLTGYIPIIGGTSLSVECLNGYYLKAFFYKADGTYLGSTVYIGNLASSTFSGTVNADASYMRILFKKSDASVFTEEELLATQITINGATHTLQRNRLVIDSTGLPYQYALAGYDENKNYIGYSSVTGGITDESKILGLASTSESSSAFFGSDIFQFVGFPANIRYLRFVFRNSDDSTITEPITGVIGIDGVTYALVKSS